MTRRYPCTMRIPQILLLAFISLPAVAEVTWQSFSVSYLKGDDYRVGDNSRDVFTFEHAAGTSWGDSFFFLDHLRSDNGDRENYAEWAPRLSLCKNKLYCPGDDGLITDVLLSGTVEMGETFTHWLYGAGVGLRVPGFKYLNLNLYRRSNEHVDDNWQITATWGVPFKLGNQQFLYDGFLDTFNGTDDQNASMNFTSQLKWDLGAQLKAKSPFYLGIEYVYWRNKYGIKDSPGFRTHEANLNLLVKWHY